MNITDQLNLLTNQYDIVGIINLDLWTLENYEAQQTRLFNELTHYYRSYYNEKQRIVITHTSDMYVKDQSVGLVLKNIQLAINEVDIRNCFVTILSTNPNISDEITQIEASSTDVNKFNTIYVEGEYNKNRVDSHPTSRKETYQYGSSNPLKISLNDLTKKQNYLLTESKTFCIYPWIHIHAWPTGQTFPCCHAENTGELGNSHVDSLKTIWNSSSMKQLRKDVLSDTPSVGCVRCYEQEASGFFSGRQSANKHHGHHISRVDETKEDGTFERFEMTYWDIRFSNLCNLSCRSCGSIFSSSWYADQVKLAGPEWATKNKALNFAGKSKTDMWEQLIPHLDYVEQIYFAGGEPLMMEEHYNILDELERRSRFDVRLIYNTNFTQTKLKDRTVFDYWKRFKSVAVGASLDAMGPRAEYIRKGTDWDTVERNREQMLEVCPKVDFYVSPTVSIMNALHVPDFHKDWVNKGFLKPQDLNVNILQDPDYYRIDIAPVAYKEKIKARYEEHLEWLRPQDPLSRATVGFESAINFMMSTDNTRLLPKFWAKTEQLDTIRNENMLDIIPELGALK